MTTEQKKTLLAMAKDSLKSFMDFKVKCGSFVLLIEPLPEETLGDQLQKHLPELKKSKKCRVCADGMLFLSAVNLYNDYLVNTDLVDPYLGEVDGDDVMDVLSAKIGREAAESIEIAFEMGGGYFGTGGWNGHRVSLPPEKQAAAIRFGKRRRSSPQRLEAILKNIIRNKGEFTPEQK